MKIDETFQDSLVAESVRERMLLTIRLVPLFLRFSTTELDEVLKICKKIKYDPMEVIFEEGSPDRKLHMILEGAVLFYIRRGRAEIIVGQRTHDTAFGEIAFITGAKRNTSAKIGPNGGEHLTIESEDMQQLTARRPEIMFKILGQIVENINERLQDLPANFRNFVVWNTRGSGVGAEEVEIPWHWLGVGLAAGAVTGLLLAMKATAAMLGAYPILKTLPWVSTAAMTGLGLFFAVVGVFSGWYYSLVQARRLRGGVGPRCCMNCSFVAWKGVPGTFGCAYQALGLKGKVLKPGKDYDTPTDCPTFQYREISRLG